MDEVDSGGCACSAKGVEEGVRQALCWVTYRAAAARVAEDTGQGLLTRWHFWLSQG